MLRRSPRIDQLAPSLCACILFLVTCAAGSGAEAARRSFDLPADAAEKSLKRFAAQSGVEVLFSTEAAAGIRTNPVKGELTPFEAVTRMVAGTRLVVVPDEKNGIIRISRGPDPNGPRAAPSTAGDRPARPDESNPPPALLPARASRADTDREQAVRLTPFTVNADADTGYRAASSLVGGRIETALDRTPSAVTVLTREFMDDIGATNFTTAAIWSTNATLQGPNSLFAEFQVNTRGVGAGANTVNYFNFANQSDGFNTERLEFARGPNSILFGISNLGGVPTTFTKQPRFRNFDQLQFKVDSFGLLRATTDTNRELLDGKVALRVNLLAQKDPRWRDHSRNDRQGIYLAGAVKLGRTAAFRFEGEYGRSQRNWGDQNLVDQISSWDTTTVYGGTGSTTIPTAGTGLTFLGGGATTDYYVYDPSRPTLGLQNLRGFYTTTGTSFSLLPGETRPYIARFPVLPDAKFNLQPDDAVVRNDYRFLSAYLEKRFGENLAVQLAWNQSHYDRTAKGTYWNTLQVDVNRFLPNGQPNEKFGQIYADAQASNQRQWNPARNLRLLANYRWETPWMEQKFSLLASETRSTFFLTFEQQVRTNNPAIPSFTNTANFIRQRRYFNQTENYEVLEAELAGHGIEVGMHRNTYNEVPSRTRSLQLAAVGSYFQSRLTSILGLRRDTNRRTSYGSTVNPDNSLTISGTPQSTGAQTGSAGLVWYPLPWIGPFVNYSRSFSLPPLGGPLLTGIQPGPTSGVGWEYGVQVKLFGERVQGRISYYDSQETGRLINVPAIANINNIWNTLGEGARLISNAPRDTQTYSATGVEVELTGNLTRNWRALFNVALPVARQTESLPGTKAYYAEHLPRWQAATADTALTPAARQTIVNQIAIVRTGIEGANDGRELNNSSKVRANLYSTYSFSGGWLKGFAAGGGANYFGKNLIGNVTGQPFSYLYMKSYYLATAHAGYSAKWGRVRYRVQLNVNNLLDNDTLDYANVRRPAGLTYEVGSGYRLLEPQKFTLATTFDF